MGGGGGGEYYFCEIWWSSCLHVCACLRFWLYLERSIGGMHALASISCHRGLLSARLYMCALTRAVVASVLSKAWTNFSGTELKLTAPIVGQHVIVGAYTSNTPSFVAGATTCRTLHRKKKKRQTEATSVRLRYTKEQNKPRLCRILASTLDTKCSGQLEPTHLLLFPLTIISIYFSQRERVHFFSTFCQTSLTNF